MNITRELIIAKVTSENKAEAIAWTGRALVALFRRQTEAEQTLNSTNEDNGIGFTGADARSGCISAKYYIKHGTLMEWQLEMWTRPNRRGVPRIAKYWAQLNDAAKQKAA